MQIIGLIAEYNPFHNGHLYQIKEIKKKYPNSIIICVLSTCFSQRGEISILNKWEKTSLALNNMIDVVLELPYFFTTQSADIFAHAALQILNEFKINILAFGSETDDLNIFKNWTSENIENKEKFKTLQKKGYNYPTIISKLKDSPKSPNDILGVAYLKEILNNKYNIVPFIIKRTNNYHDNNLNSEIVSASNIRNKFYNNESITQSIPKDCYQLLKDKKINKKKYFDLIKYKIIVDTKLKNYLDVDEGLENRISNYILNYETEDKIIGSIKSKRYSYNKIYRMLNHILIGLTKKDANEIKNVEYIRLLGFNNHGKKYINKIKKDFNYPIIYNYNKDFKTSKYELIATKIYSLIIKNNLLIREEYKKNIINK